MSEQPDMMIDKPSPEPKCRRIRHSEVGQWCVTHQCASSDCPPSPEPNETWRDFDICECGDYRRDHQDGKGACHFTHHGIVPASDQLNKCAGFTLASRTKGVPENEQVTR